MYVHIILIYEYTKQPLLVKSMLTQTICKGPMPQHQTSALSVPATLLFLLDGWKAFYATVEKSGQ